MSVQTADRLQSGIQLWPKESCLLSRLVDELSRLPMEQLRRVLIVLPTHRLGTVLLAMLTQKKQVIVAPTITTWDGFVDQAFRPSFTLKKVFPDSCSELLLRHLLKEKKYRYLTLGFEHELLQFFGEIIDCGLDKEAFSRLRQTFLEDVYQSEQFLALLKERTDEIESLFLTFQKRLPDSAFCLQQHHRLERYQHLQDVCKTRPLLPWVRVYVACFTTFKHLDLIFLKSIIDKANLSVWLTKPLSLMSHKNPSQEMIDYLGNNTITRVDNTLISTTSPKKIVVRSFAHPMAEARQVVAVAQNYIANGCLPSEIAILITNESLYTSLLKHYLQQASLVANVAVASRLGQTPIGIYVSLLLKFVLEGETKEDLLALMMHPVSDDVFCDRKKTITSLERFKYCQQLLACKKTTLLVDMVGALEKGACREYLHVMLDRLQPWMGLFADGKKTYPLQLWYQRLSDLIHVCTTVDDVEEESKECLSTLKDSTQSLLHAMASVITAYPVSMTSVEFVRFVREHVFPLEVRTVGYPLKGIQVLRLTESRYVPFKVAIVLGCIEGQFPQALPKDYLIDDWLKKKIGLPGWEYVESLEDTTFQLLLARVPRVEFFYPKKINQELTVPSRFIETLKAKGQVLVVDSEVSFREEAVESSPAVVLPPQISGDYQGDRVRLLERVSASSLQDLLTCPYRYLLNALKLKSVKLFEDRRLLVEGSYLHQVVEVLFTGKTRSHDVIEPLKRRLKTTEVSTYLLNRLLTISDRLAYSELSRTLFYHLRFHSWPLLSKHLAQFYEATDVLYSEFNLTYQVLTEYALHHRLGSKVSIPIDYEVDGARQMVDIGVSGVIDYLLLAGDCFLLLDYKRHRVSSQKEMVSGVNPQLLLYALSLSHLKDKPLSLEDGLIGYWSLLEGKWYNRGVGKHCREKEGWGSLFSKRSESLPDQVFQLKQLWGERYKELVVDKKPFAVTETKHCLYCDFSSICQHKKKEAQFVPKGS